MLRGRLCGRLGCRPPNMLVSIAGDFADGAGLLCTGPDPIVIAQCGLQKILVISVDFDIVPLFLGAAIDNLCQGGAAVKCMVGNTVHAVGDGNAVLIRQFPSGAG